MNATATPLPALPSFRWLADSFCVTLVLLSVNFSSPAHAAIIDVAPSVVEVNAGNGICSLLEAVLNANADNDTSGGDCLAGSGADTIHLAAGSIYSISEHFVGSASGLPPLTGILTIEGNGAIIERTAGTTDEFRILFVQSTGNVTIEDLTVGGGNFRGFGAGILNEGTILLSNSAVRNNTTARSGAGIYNSGTLTVLNSEITSNNVTQAQYGGGWPLQ